MRTEVLYYTAFSFYCRPLRTAINCSEQTVRLTARKLPSEQYPSVCGAQALLCIVLVGACAQTKEWRFGYGREETAVRS